VLPTPYCFGLLLYGCPLCTAAGQCTACAVLLGAGVVMHAACWVCSCRADVVLPALYCCLVSVAAGQMLYCLWLCPAAGQRPPDCTTLLGLLLLYCMLPALCSCRADAACLRCTASGCCSSAADVQLLGSVLPVQCAGAERHCLSLLVQLACGCASPLVRVCSCWAAALQMAWCCMGVGWQIVPVF
jgi:hypothetical protein